MIKKNRNKNFYWLTSSGLWVRDYTKKAVPEDINCLITESDYDVILKNEMANVRLNLASIDAETIFAPNVIIVSDGYEFEKKQHLIKKIPQDRVTVIGTNKALAKWARHTRMDWYVVNNPYSECMHYLPQHNYYPRCVVSNRTNPDFVQRYRSRLGVIYRYTPVSDAKFCSHYFQEPLYYVDDYRNPICAAINLAYRWEVRNLLLFCCDDSFAGERPGAVRLKNELWNYPTHDIAHGLIEGTLHWLSSQQNIKINIADHSSGPEYNNVKYITETELVKFFD